MRETCLGCCTKHLAQAIVLLCESQKGYPLNALIAFGHLAEAEDEVVCDHPKLAIKIREIRLLIEIDIKNGVLLLELLEKLRSMIVDESKSESTTE